MSTKMKWGIIGLGKIANKFAEALTFVEDAELYAVASRSANSAQDFAKKYNAMKSYGSYEAIVDDDNVDIVYIATPHSFHKAHALLCLKNKKPVLCEKPLSHKLSDVKEMIETSRSNATFLMEAMWTRCLPPTIRAMEIIKSGKIGHVKKVKADFGFNSPYDEKGRLYDMHLGGGSLMDVGVYPLFLALTVLGKPISAKAIIDKALTGADKVCNFTLEYSDAIAELQSSIIEDTSKEAWIVGTKGSIKFESPWYRQTNLLVVDENGNEEKIKFDYLGNGFEPEIIEAIRCVKEGKIESELMSHEFSLLQSQVLEDLCNSCGLIYP
jgi:predicted dehydrogenase